MVNIGIKNMETKTINKYTFFIGWNNDTHKREIKKAIQTISDLKVLGYSINKNLLGFWESTQENSFNIEIIGTTENPFNDIQAKCLKEKLEKNLKQYLVLTTKQAIELIN